MDIVPANSDELFANVEALWKEDPIKAFGYLLSNWNTMLIFW
jgi:hypothetical protein